MLTSSMAMAGSVVNVKLVVNFYSETKPEEDGGELTLQESGRLITEDLIDGLISSKVRLIPETNFISEEEFFDLQILNEVQYNEFSAHRVECDYLLLVNAALLEKGEEMFVSAYLFNPFVYKPLCQSFKKLCPQHK